MNFVTNDLDLALFINARNRIKFNCREAVRKYIKRRRNIYARQCYQEDVPETATHQKYRHIMGAEKGHDWCGAFARPLKCSRDLTKDSPWKLAPNRYDVPSEVLASRKGSSGAYWPKLHTHKPLIEKKFERTPRYNIVEIRRLGRWIFPKNARYRRPSLRIMITSLTGCYRDPKEPGATHYFPKTFLMENNVSPPIKSEPPNPHLFLRASCVPSKPNSLIPRHISMDPTPGRYETRYRDTCVCYARLIIMPGLALFVDRQKRNRFRHLPYQRIKIRMYCDPEWNHVAGHGFRHLFKTPARTSGLKLKAVVKASENLRLKLFHDQRYMATITNPERTPISWRLEPLPELPTRIKYNSLSKRIIRKQLRSNKKIAFNSGQERWKDGYRLPILTYKQQQLAKASLPLERQLRDQPVMRHSFSEIRPKLEQTPKHMLPGFVPELRKRLFKFLPLPGAKVLVTEQDTRPEMVNGRYQCENYYAKEVIAEHFFIDGASKKLPRREDEEQPDDVSVAPVTDTTMPTPALPSEATEKRLSKEEPKVRLSQDL